MASNYTEYSTSLSDEEQSTIYSEEKPENLLPRKSPESASNPAEDDQEGIKVSQHRKKSLIPNLGKKLFSSW